MLLLVATTDKLQLVTDAAVTVDVHVSYMDYNGSTVTPGRQNTAVSTAATTDVVASPGASSQRNIKTFNARNKAASASVGVTVLYNQNGTTFELHKVTLRPGECLEYIEGVGFFTLGARLPVSPNVSTADQSPSAGSANYITGSALLFTANPTIGTALRWMIALGKTGAGTGTTAFAIYFGPNGTTGDTSRCATGNLDTETAIADEMRVEILAIIRGPISASCIVQSGWEIEDNLTTTGFSNTARKAQVKAVQSSAFDITGLPLYAGIVITPGAADVITIRSCIAEVVKA